MLDEPTPQLRHNVSGFEITIDTATSGAEETGGSGSGSSGVSTCELTLNPQLVDENGDSITVQTDGAELLVIWGYPNSNQVRSHTFAQVGVRDSFFNEQKTQLSFRGRSWKLSRLSEQKRYPSGDLKERVYEVGRQMCKQLGYLDSDCPDPPVVIEPPEALDDIEIGETSQDGSITDYMTRLVERAKGCTFHTNIDRDAYNDADRNKLKLAINCVSSLNDEIEPETNLVLVDRALWLGQGLAEKVELSDSGDTASSTSNTGGNCGGQISRVSRPKNIILRSFEKGCDYRILNRSQLENIRSNTANEFILRLVLNDSEDVPLLAPFTGKVIEIGPEPLCNNTKSADNTCGGKFLASGSGNFIKIQASEPNNTDLDGIVWTFYYIASTSIEVGATFDAGDAIATQGSSGTVEKNITGVRIERAGEKLPTEEGIVFINDYLDTITFACKSLNGSCYLSGFVTSGALQPGLGGTKDHIHYETLRGLNDAISAFDNMANADPETCYNLNQIINGTKNVGPRGERACWNTAWDEKTKKDVVNSCRKSHSHSPPKGPNNYKCDFWVFDRKTELINNGGRFDSSARNRPIANPYPDISHRFMNTNAGPPLGAAVLFFDDPNKPATNTIGFDSSNNVFAMLLHGDSEILNAPLSPGGPVIQGCINSNNTTDNSGFSIEENEFLKIKDFKGIDSELLIVQKTNDSVPRGFNFNTPGSVASLLKLIVADLVLEKIKDNSFIENSVLNFTKEIKTNENLFSQGTITIKKALENMLKESGNVSMNILIKEVLGGLESSKPLLSKYGYIKTKLNYYGLLVPNGLLASSTFFDIGKAYSNLIKKQNNTVNNALKNSKHLLGTSEEESLKAGFISNFVGTFSSHNINNEVYIIGIGFRRNSINNKFYNLENQKKLKTEIEKVITILKSPDSQQIKETAKPIDCGPKSNYPNLSPSDAEVLNKFCQEEGCNAKDVAAFIQAECGWNLNNTLNPKCSGAFQCCTGQAPEAKMKEILESQGETFFKNCNSIRTGQPLINHLKAWKAYKQASVGVSGNVPVNAGLCANYTQIALPALVPAIQANVNASFKEACTAVTSNKTCLSFYQGNLSTWFRGKSYENATLSGICNYARRGALDDSRLDGGCNFIGEGTGFDVSQTAACTNTSSNRSLNSRNTGTLSSGGLRDIKFRQEIKLNAEFGVCPRNVFLSPTDTNGKPNYILLANMDNSEGFSDFKIRSVTLTWKGSWRWSITAYRPATDVTFETPPTLVQPRSLNEWISYYWLLDRDFINEASQFAPPGDNPLILSDGTLDPSVPVPGSAITFEATNSLTKLTTSIDNFFFEENNRSGDFTDEQADTLESLSQKLRESCAGIVPACLTAVQRYTESEAFRVYIDSTIRDPEGSGAKTSLSSWFDRELINRFKDVADFVNEETSPSA